MKEIDNKKDILKVTGMKSKYDYIPFSIIEKKNGEIAAVLGDIEIPEVLNYRIESSTTPGTVKLTLEFIAKFP